MTQLTPMVFVVDDDDLVRQALTRLISSVGFRVEEFSSAQDFLRAVREDVPSCLVLDVRMPGLSGLDLQKELGRMGQCLPIIFLTGHGNIPMSVRALKDGAVDFLEKPFEDETLLQAIKKAIQQDISTKSEQAEMGCGESVPGRTSA